MEISALFENVDMAEFALVNLQGLGIFPERYKIRSIHDSEDGADQRFLPIAGVTGGASAVSTPINAVTGMAHDNTAFSGGEAPNQEVQLLLTVRDDAADRTRSALISNHGRRVRAL